MSERNPHTCDLMLVIAHMGEGGAQRVASLLLNHWAGQGRRICLVTLSNKPDANFVDKSIARFNVAGDLTGDLIGSLDDGDATKSNRLIVRALYKVSGVVPTSFSKVSGLERQVLALCRFIIYLFGGHASRRIARLRSLFNIYKPRAVLSFLGSTNVQTIMAGSGILKRIVISERNDPALQFLSPPWDFLRKFLYGSADVVTANSKGALQTMRSFVPTHKLVYMPNPVCCHNVSVDIKGRRKVILAVARLVEQKGLDVLIRAFAAIYRDIPDWCVEIVGDGVCKARLLALCKECNVESRVAFLGFRRNVADYYGGASIFVLPSRYEGMPNALIEAMSYGMAAIVSDSSPGPLELITHGFNGLVFSSENHQSLASCIMTLATDQELRLKMGTASQMVSQQFNLPSVASKWESLLFNDKSNFLNIPAIHQKQTTKQNET